MKKSAQLQKMLGEIGLSEKSAQLYIALLSLGTSSLQDAASAAKLKRTTAHFHLDDLLERGFAERVPIGKKDYYRAADSTTIEQRIAARVQKLQNIVPQIVELQTTASAPPATTLLEGKDALEQVYEEIVANAATLRIFSNLSAVEQDWGHMYKRFTESMKDGDLDIREIIADTPKAIKTAKQTRKLVGTNYKAKVADRLLHNDNIIFNDSIVFFRFDGLNVSAVRVDDKLISHNLKTLFDMAWKNASPI